MNKISVYRPIFIRDNFILRVLSQINNTLYVIFHFKKLILHNDTIQKLDYNIDRKENELICFLCCNILFC